MNLEEEMAGETRYKAPMSLPHIDKPSSISTVQRNRKSCVCQSPILLSSHATSTKPTHELSRF